MPIVTPRQLVRRAHLYRQLGQMLEAGVTISQALDMLSRNPPSPAFRAPLLQMRAQIADGAVVSEALRCLGRWVPEFDLALVKAAEQSGRLDGVFRALADYCEDRARLMRQIISDLLYPAFLLHFAIFLFPFIQWFSSTLSPGMFLLETFGILVPLYAAIFLMIYATDRKRSLAWRAFMEKLIRPIPVLGSGLHDLALARLSASLEALISAGMNIVEGWELAATTSGSPAIWRAVIDWRPQVNAGQTPAEAVNSAPRQFPEVFANLYNAGEVSGKLDETLRRLWAYYQEEGTRKLHLVAKWVPQFIYYGVAGIIAYKVIHFYTGYFQAINDASKI